MYLTKERRMKKKDFTTVGIKANDLDSLKEIAAREHRSMAQQISYWIEQDQLKQLQREAS